MLGITPDHPRRASRPASMSRSPRFGMSHWSAWRADGYERQQRPTPQHLARMEPIQFNTSKIGVSPAHQADTLLSFNLQQIGYCTMKRRTFARLLTLGAGSLGLLQGEALEAGEIPSKEPGGDTKPLPREPVN